MCVEVISISCVKLEPLCSDSNINGSRYSISLSESSNTNPTKETGKMTENKNGSRRKKERKKYFKRNQQLIQALNFYDSAILSIG